MNVHQVLPLTAMLVLLWDEPIAGLRVVLQNIESNKGSDLTNDCIHKHFFLSHKE